MRTLYGKRTEYIRLLIMAEISRGNLASVGQTGIMLQLDPVVSARMKFRAIVIVQWRHSGWKSRHDTAASTVVGMSVPKIKPILSASQSSWKAKNNPQHYYCD